MKKAILSLGLFFAFYTLTAQVNRTVHEYTANQDSTVYSVIHQIYKANDPFSYLNTFLSHRYKLPHRDPLTAAEGADGMIAEANIYLPFTIARGRDFSKDHLQAMRFTFDYWGQIRIAQDSSSPILPPTNSFGIGFDWTFWDNFRDKEKFVDCDSKARYGCCFDARNFWKEMKTRNRAYHMWYLGFKLNHYSNGQGNRFYVDDAVPRRHDYEGGNFSTNYARLTLNYNTLSNESRLLSTTIGFQQEIGSNSGFLSFARQQEQSYGRSRIVGMFAWRSKPSAWWTYRGTSKDCNNNKKYNLRELVDYSFRANLEYILGDVSNWRQGDFSNAERFNIHLYLQITPVRFRTIGVNFHYYYGRDYHNIRFDNVVHTFQMGIAFNVNKYKPIMADLNELGADWIE